MEGHGAISGGDDGQVVCRVHCKSNELGGVLAILVGNLHLAARVGEAESLTVS